MKKWLKLLASAAITGAASGLTTAAAVPQPTFKAIGSVAAVGAIGGVVNYILRNPFAANAEPPKPQPANPLEER
jgi:hypothetical protein